ncbi:MAG: HD domain-containing protein, partial [Firmicutes bacterium]|nr:HD domain-containing protein [Bacillota bacterium]
AERESGGALPGGRQNPEAATVPLEITTFRKETGYADHRHPDAVIFTDSLEEDLARRDFTINAMAMRPAGTVPIDAEGCDTLDFRDPFGGMADLEDRVIRCVGDPARRFSEDALRILRALRFASVLGFTIEPATRKALFDARQQLRYVSAERIAEELLKLLCGRSAESVLLEYADVLGSVLPELLPLKGFDQKTPHHIYDVLTHTAKVVSGVPAEPVQRLAALCHDWGKPHTFTLDENGRGHFYGHPKHSVLLAEEAFSRLKLSNEIRETALSLIRFHDIWIDDTPRAVKRWLNKIGPALFFPLLELKKADNRAQSPASQGRLAHYDALEERARTILAEGQCFALKDLAVTGKDLIVLGMEPGPQLGKALYTLLELVMEETLPNQRDALLSYAGERFTL